MTDAYDLEQLNLHKDPAKEPLTYPGRAPEWSGLLAYDRYLRLSCRDGRRLGQWRTVWPEENLSADLDGSSHYVPINYALLRYNQAPVGLRYPVLAVGCNSSPARLNRKFSRRGVAAVLPMTQAKVKNLSIGISAHISKPGYIPATPIAAINQETDVFVCWLSKDQLFVLDQTEPNYRRIFLPSAGFPVTLQYDSKGNRGEVLGGCYAYESIHGHLTNNGDPRILGDQYQLMAALLDESVALRTLFGDRPEAMCSRVAQNQDLAHQGKRIFENEGWVASLTLENIEGQHCYDELPSDFSAAQTQLANGPLLVRSTPDGLDRKGQVGVRLSGSHADRLGKHNMVLVRPGNAAADYEDIATLARVWVSNEVANDRCIEVDQIVRNAIGVEIQEQVDVMPVTLRRPCFLDRAIGEPNYVTCRVQNADLRTIEGGVCIVDPLTLQLLGVQIGDFVVIEGLPDVNNEIPQVVIQAFVSEEVQLRREQLHGGNFTSRFPSSRDALGVYPDLPWVFLDSSTRATLGLPEKKLGTVRIRARRRHQFVKEIRDLLLLIGLAVIGLVTAFKETHWRVAFLVALTVIVLAVVTVRLRGRLTHAIKRRRRAP
ncbi:hypothetical protein ABZ613_04715 [Streptomyces collinus]|uniref:hypothetical protein n=1 Tax=Streptomyces collinus TaxID=42684 RepID=UPI00340F4F30